MSILASSSTSGATRLRKRVFGYGPERAWPTRRNSSVGHAVIFPSFVRNQTAASFVAEVAPVAEGGRLDGRPGLRGTLSLQLLTDARHPIRERLRRGRGADRRRQVLVHRSPRD